MLQLFRKFASALAIPDKGKEGHRLRSIGKLAGTAVALTGLGLLTLLPVPAQNAADPGSEKSVEGPESEVGFFGYSGGFVRGKRALTSTTAKTILESAPAWVNLTSPTTGAIVVLPWTVPAATTDLFNVAFSAECGTIGGATVGDWVRIRILDNGVPMEPYDGNHNFCGLAIGANGTGMGLHKGNWVKRVGPGAHSLTVQFMIVDNVPLGAVSAFIDDWTFEVVVYD